MSATAHRSRACTRQNGGRVGAARRAREAGFLAAREGARVALPPRVLVTTVRPRLPPDLVVLVDVPPVELRTYVRYPSPMALRWALAENEGAGTLFPDERVAERHVGKGAY